MRLIAASGSQEMKNALVNEHAQKIVSILIKELEKKLFKVIVRFLKNHEQRTSAIFTKDLQALRSYSSRDTDTNGQFVPPPYLEELCLALEALYDATPTVVNFRRGAIVELLAYELVNSRCRDNECWSNHRFVNRSNGYASDQ